MASMPEVALGLQEAEIFLKEGEQPFGSAVWQELAQVEVQPSLEMAFRNASFSDTDDLLAPAVVLEGAVWQALQLPPLLPVGYDSGPMPAKRDSDVLQTATNPDSTFLGEV